MTKKVRKVEIKGNSLTLIKSITTNIQAPLHLMGKDYEFSLKIMNTCSHCPFSTQDDGLWPEGGKGAQIRKGVINCPACG